MVKPGLCHNPFFVIATQNPVDQIGTFPLPESQLDRFLMRITLGYPDQAAERALLEGEERRQMLTELPVQLSPVELLALQKSLTAVTAAPSLLGLSAGAADGQPSVSRLSWWFVTQGRSGIAESCPGLGTACRTAICYTRGMFRRCFLPLPVIVCILPRQR